MAGLGKAWAITLLCLSVLVAGCQTTARPTGEIPERRVTKTDAVTAATWRSQTSLAQMEDIALTASDAAYFLRKSGFDPAPGEVAPWIGQPRSQLISQVLATLSTRPVVPVPDWTKVDPRYWGHRDWSEAKRSAFSAARRQEVASLRQWWLAQMLASPSPLGERMVMFWENIFVAGFSGIEERSHAQWMHHDAIRKHALGNYEDLLRAMLRDPAVLTYLDNVRNTRESPNENLARELFELYTMGEGNYTERDIREAARTLAGWHVSELGRLRFVEKGWARDYGRKTIFGESGNFNGDDLADLILQQPATHAYMARRLWQEFVSAEAPPPEILAGWAEAFRATGFDMRQMLEVVFHSEAFWDPVYRGTSAKSPLELVIGAARYSRTNALSLSEIDSTLQAMGQTLFDPPDVSGWGYGDYWLDPSLLIERDRFQQEFAERISGADMQKAQQAPDGRVIRVKLAGEAYRGDPLFVVTIRHDGGVWRSPSIQFEEARDTERLGRYGDESEFVWSIEEVPIDAPIGEIKEVSVGFRNDAAGNDGDRNLFIGGLELGGISIPGSAGIQSPGCGSDGGGGAKRHPDRLYCRGDVTYDWQALTARKNQTPPEASNPDNLVTREMVLRYASPPDRDWRSVNIAFDTLRYQGRSWDYLGVSIAIDRDGRYQLQFQEDLCEPSCLTRWPIDGYRDEAGIRHSSVYLRPYEDWMRRQYTALSSEDKQLAKAILDTLPEVERRSGGSRIHRSEAARAFWAKHLRTFVTMTSSGQWQPEFPTELVELDAATSDQMASMSMNNSRGNNMGMGGMGMSAGSYSVATGTVTDETAWLDALEAHLALAAEPLEAWGLSISEGERLTAPTAVVTSPYANLK